MSLCRRSFDSLTGNRFTRIEVRSHVIEITRRHYPAKGGMYFAQDPESYATHCCRWIIDSPLSEHRACAFAGPPLGQGVKRSGARICSSIIDGPLGQHVACKFVWPFVGQDPQSSTSQNIVVILDGPFGE